MARCSSLRTSTTRYRTVDLRRPTPTQPMAAVLAFPEPEVVEVALDDIEVVDDIEVIEEIDTARIELDEIEIEIEIEIEA